MKLLVIKAFLLLTLLACQKSSPIEKTEITDTHYFIRIASQNGVTIDYSSVAIVKASTAGNGGQFNENNFGKLSYSGYQSGFYTVSLENKQECGIDFLLSWIGIDTTIHINALSTKMIQLPGIAQPDQLIKAKPLYKCGTSGGDMGYLEVSAPVSLPIKLKHLTASNYDAKQIIVSFEASEAYGSDKFYIQLSKDGLHYYNVLTIDANKITPNTLYSFYITKI